MPPCYRRPVFEDPPRQYVAIVGKTGCGEVTLLRLLLALKKPQKGAVYWTAGPGEDRSAVAAAAHRRGDAERQAVPGGHLPNIVISAPWLTQQDAWEAAGCPVLPTIRATCPMA